MDAYGADLDQVRDAYLLAMDLGHIAKAAAWERGVTGLSPCAMGGHHGATAAWLADLAVRLAG